VAFANLVDSLRLIADPRGGVGFDYVATDHNNRHDC